MDKNKLIELTLTQWTASLKSRDRSRKNVRPNFEELFQAWKQSGASFNDLYENLLPKAIKAHQPIPSVARSMYKNLKQKLGSKMDKSEKEFIEEWNASIEATGQEVFFEFFPATTLDKDDEPKVFGNMSATEYRAQQRRTEQFKTLSTDELIKQWKSQSTYDLDVETTLENILGGSDEINS
jgi:hypothetical protein